MLNKTLLKIKILNTQKTAAADSVIRINSTPFRVSANVIFYLARKYNRANKKDFAILTTILLKKFILVNTFVAIFLI
jgi:hypothetical protein